MIEEEVVTESARSDQKVTESMSTANEMTDLGKHMLNQTDTHKVSNESNQGVTQITPNESQVPYMLMIDHLGATMSQPGMMGIPYPIDPIFSLVHHTPPFLHYGHRKVDSFRKGKWTVHALVMSEHV
jgi:hypothetical protein